MRAALVVTLCLMIFGPGGRVASGQDARGFKDRLEAIVAAQDAEHRRYVKVFEDKAPEAVRDEATASYRGEVGRHADEALALVRENPRDPGVVAALGFVIKIARGGPGDQSYRAMEILLRDHVGDPGMGATCGPMFSFWQSAEAESLFRAVMERNPNRDDRGLACHTLAYTLNLRAGFIRRVRSGDTTVENHVAEHTVAATKRMVAESDPDALEQEAAALLERVIAEYADVRFWFDSGRTLGAIADGELFAIRHLAVGKVAPDIKGVDHEGKAFALGDYRGKVVVLTFSAEWCGPCVGMYPQGRALVKRHEGRPFALVSVDLDPERETLAKAVESGKITWRCWWDGGINGPITTRWGVSAVPSIFVLDRDGVIRFKDVRGDLLDRAVDSLMEE